MRRREFITLLGGAVAGWPLVALGQQASRLVRIGFLSGGAGPNPNVYGFQHGLRQLGYVEGQNLVLIYRWAAAQRAPIVDLARELLELNVDVLASHTTEAISAIRSLNTAIPVVMTAISDPIGNGLVASFARPGGNTTGVTLFSNELAGKRLEMLNQLVPQLRRVAILAERDRPPTATLVSETQAAGTAAGVVLYFGLALIVTARVRNPIVRAIAWIVAVVAPALRRPALAALPRRCTSPPTSRSAVLLGTLRCLAVLPFVVRTAVAVARRRKKLAVKEPVL